MRIHCNINYGSTATATTTMAETMENLYNAMQQMCVRVQLVKNGINRLHFYMHIKPAAA